MHKQSQNWSGVLLPLNLSLHLKQNCLSLKKKFLNFALCFRDIYKLSYTYEGHSVNSEIRCVSAIAYLLAESWCCLYKASTFISHNTKETIS